MQGSPGAGRLVHCMKKHFVSLKLPPCFYQMIEIAQVLENNSSRTEAEMPPHFRSAHLPPLRKSNRAAVGRKRGVGIIAYQSIDIRSLGQGYGIIGATSPTAPQPSRIARTTGLYVCIKLHPPHAAGTQLTAGLSYHTLTMHSTGSRGSGLPSPIQVTPITGFPQGLAQP